MKRFLRRLWPWKRTERLDTALPPANPTRRGRWKRWGLRFALGFALLLIAIRIALPWIVPYALQKIADGYGLETRLERLEVALLHGEVGFSGLVVRDPERDREVARAGFVRARIAWLDLLIGRLRLYRVDVDDLALHLERDADGGWTWLERFAPTAAIEAPPAAQDPSVSSAAEPSSTSPTDAPLLALENATALPLRIDAMRLHRARIHWTDAYAGEALRASLEVALRAEHLGYQDDQPARFEFELAAQPGLSSLHAQARMNIARAGIHGDLSLKLNGLLLTPFRRYLEPLHITPPAAHADIEARAAVFLRDAAPAQYLHGLIEVQGLHYAEAGVELAHLDHVAVRTENLSAEELHFDQIAVRGAHAAVRSHADGSMSFGGWMLHPPTSDRSSTAQVAQLQPEDHERGTVTEPPQPPATRAQPSASSVPDLATLWPANLPRLRIRELRIEAIEFQYEDTARALPLALALHQAELLQLDTRPLQAHPPARLRLRAALPNYVEAIELDGKLQPFAAEAQAQLELRCLHLQPTALDQLLARLGQNQIGVEATRFEARLSASARQLAASSTEVEARVEAVRVEGAEGVVLLRLEEAHAQVRVPRDTGPLVASAIRLRGLETHAVRRPDGMLHCAGVRVATLPAAPSTSIPETSAAARATAPTQAASAAQQPLVPEQALDPSAMAHAPILHIEDLQVREIALRFEDQSGTTSEPLELRDFELALRDAYYPRPPAESKPAQLSWNASLPGVVEALALQAQFDSTAEAPSFQATFDARGITARRLQPLLERMGIACELQAGELQAKAEGTLAFEADRLRAPLVRVETLAVRDRERELMELKEARIENFELRRTSQGIPAIDIGVVRWEACSLALEMRSAEEFAALGFAMRQPRSRDSAAQQSSATSDTSKTTEASQSQAPQPALDAAPEASANETRVPLHFHLAELDLPALELRLTDPKGKIWPLSMSSRGSALRFAPLETDPPRGQFRFAAKVPQTLEALEFDADVHASPTRLDVQAELRSRGIDLLPLQAYLAELGLMGEMRAGSAHMQLALELEQREQALLAAVRIADVSVQDGAREWLGVDRIEAEGLRYASLRADMGKWRIERPRAAVELRADGRTAVLGLVIGNDSTKSAAAVAPQNALPAQELPAPSTEHAALERGESPPSTRAHVATELARQTLPTLGLEGLSIRDARLDLIDQRNDKSRSLPIVLHAELGTLDTAQPDTLAPLQIELLPEPGDGKLLLQGGLGLNQDQLAFQLRFEGRELDLTRYQDFLPPQVDARAEQGTLDGSVTGFLRRDPDSADLSAKLSTNAWRWGARGAEQPWLAWTRAAFDLERIASDGTLRIAELRCEGLTASVEHDHGSFRALGLNFTPAPAAQPPSALAAATPTPARPQNAASESIAQTLAADSSAPDGTRTIQRAVRDLLPRVLIDDLSIELEALHWIDHVDAEHAERGVATFALKNDHPIDCLGPQYNEAAPIHLSAHGQVSPGVQSFSLTCESNPFSAQPHFELDFQSAGIDAPALRAAAPVLLATLDAEHLRGGSCAGKIDAELRFPRTGPLDFRIQRELALFLNVSEFALKDADDQVLLGVEELFLAAPRIELQRGYAFLRRIDITRPQLRVVRTNRGFEAFGIVLENAPAAQSAPATEPASLTSEAAGAARAPELSAPASSTPAPKAPAPQFVAELQEFQIFDGSFHFEDRSVDPPLLVPLQSIDLGIENLSTAPNANALPIKFDVNVLAAEVPLPKRVDAGPVPGLGFVTGMLGGIADQVTGADRKLEMEERPLFAELRAEGIFTPQWPPQGHVEFELAGFELSALTSSAKQASVDIADGVLDAQVELKVDSQGIARGRNRFFFSHLDIDEPADGPIQRYLKLPAPLNVVVFAVMDDTGAVRIPVDFDQALASGMGQGQIVSIAIDSLARTLTHAIERSAFRVVGFVTNFGDSVIGGLPLIGNIWNFFFSSAVPPEILEPLEIPFAPGDGYLESSYLESIEIMVQRMRAYPKLDVVVEHRSGLADIARATERGAPDSQALQDLRTRLDQELLIATRAREVLLEQIEAAILDDRSDLAIAARKELAARDQRIGELFDARQQVLRWMDERRQSESDRRARYLQIEFARLRMKSVERALRQATPEEDFSKRIRLPRPRPDTPALEDQGGGKIILRPALRRR